MTNNLNEPWLGRDHIIVVQAARNLPTEPMYAERLLEEAERPLLAALQLLELLLRVETEGRPVHDGIR